MNGFMSRHVMGSRIFLQNNLEENLVQNEINEFAYWKEIAFYCWCQWFYTIKQQISRFISMQEWDLISNLPMRTNQSYWKKIQENSTNKEGINHMATCVQKGESDQGK